jgi:3-oxoacyl-[acyl-carrier protein] reductase
MRLKNKVAIVTGAASGIGQATALALAQQGAKIVVADWSEEQGQATLEQLKKQGAEAIFIKTDVSQTKDIEQMVLTCLKKFNQIDILVNNAGIFRTSFLHETTDQDWDQVLNVNLKGVFLSSRRVLEEMLKQKKGKIINVASIAGLRGFAQNGAYCASKAGIINLTRVMALEYAAQNINVNCVAPGIIKTAMTEQMLADPATKKSFDNDTPYSRLGVPEDIAAAIVYLASEESNFVNGETLVVDGGWTAK